MGHPTSAQGPDLESDEPTLEEALESNDRLFWWKAMEEEYKSLMENGTWSPVENPPKTPIKTKWILKKKRLPDGTLDKYKARLAVLG
jgi:hypothetical protein